MKSFSASLMFMTKFNIDRSWASILRSKSDFSVFCRDPRVRLQEDDWILIIWSIIQWRRATAHLRQLRQLWLPIWSYFSLRFIGDHMKQEVRPNASPQLLCKMLKSFTKKIVKIHYRPNSRLGIITGPYFVGGVNPESPWTTKSTARLSFVKPWCPLCTLAAYCVPAMASGSYATKAT